MKWTTHELIKLESQNFEINETIDLTEYIHDTDIIKISPVHVTGEFEIEDRDEFIFYLTIECTLTLPCALTLKEVEYVIDIDTEDVFSFKPNDDSHIIDGITIDLSPIIWSNIILEKPMRVLSENAYDEIDFQNEDFEIDDKKNTFASLKNYNQ
jgi:uncharacterized protein